jgi:MSHA biogenesis protein MshP
MKRRHHGFGAIAAIVVLVLLALLAATVVRMSRGAQGGFAQELQAARVHSAARAGIDWGLWQLLRGSWVGCSGGLTQTLDLRSTTGARVTVSCSVNTYNEGSTAPGVPRVVRVYSLRAVACTGAAASCPDNAAATSSQYVERERAVTLTDGLP